MAGDIWNVPLFPQSRFAELSADIWHATKPLLSGYWFKCFTALESTGRTREQWLDAESGRMANELGAPVGQAITVVLLRRRTP
jgi:hypothetical protein